MKNNIYKEMIEESPIPYALIKVVEENGECVPRLIDINKGFIEVFNINKEDVMNKSINELFGEEVNKEALIDIRMSKWKKYTRTKYIDLYKTYAKIEIYAGEDSEYHVRILKINKNDNRLSDILRKSPFISWIKDINGRYVDVNDKYLEMINLNYQQVIGKSDEELLGNKIARVFKNKDNEVLERNELIMYQDVLDIDDKFAGIFETAKWPYSDNGVILGTIGVSVDITDKVRMKEAMERNEQNLIDMANNLDEVIIVRDEKKALYISPYFEDLYGFKPEDLYDDIKNWDKYWDSVEYIGDPPVYNYKKIDNCICRVVKEGKIDKWIQSKFIPIFNEQGEIVKKIVLIRDITAKMKLDEELERLRMEFFANLSHELRTPINLIMSSLQVIDMKYNKKMENDLLRYLGVIDKNSKRLIKLIDNLIDTTKINSGNYIYNPVNRDIVSFIESIVTSVVEFVEKNNLEIVFDTDVEEKIIAFDPCHIERIMLNLISNAIKFNKEKGKIEVHISTNEDVKIIVKDNGIGIPYSKLEDIFEGFEQVNKHNRREREGSGIGLSLVKSLVEMNKGYVELNSSLGKGSEFIITLPDILTEEEGEDFYSVNNSNKVEIEFSDIYC